MKQKIEQICVLKGLGNITILTIVVLGERKQVDLNYLANFGEVQELKMEQIFGY